MKTYEAMLIFPGSLTEEAVTPSLDKVKVEIERLQGRIVEASNLGRRNFSRPMHKQESGYYVRMRFELDPASLAGLPGRLKLNENLFRIQIVVAEPPAPPKPEPEPVNG